MSVFSGHNKTSYGSSLYSTTGGLFCHCPFLLDLFNLTGVIPFADGGNKTVGILDNCLFFTPRLPSAIIVKK